MLDTYIKPSNLFREQIAKLLVNTSYKTKVRFRFNNVWFFYISRYLLFIVQAYVQKFKLS